jgi:hypothetical protein
MKTFQVLFPEHCHAGVPGDNQLRSRSGISDIKIIGEKMNHVFQNLTNEIILIDQKCSRQEDNPPAIPVAPA